MFTWLRTHKLLTVLLIILIFVIACWPTLNYLNNEIDHAISLNATDVSQCKTIPYGRKACGGPAGHIVYSAASTDIGRYSRLVTLRDVLQKIIFAPLLLLSPSGASTCNVEMPPKLELSSGQCRSVENSAASAF
jgi:hypothetical protein